MAYIVRKHWRELVDGVFWPRTPGEVIDPVDEDDIPRLLRIGVLVDENDAASTPTVIVTDTSQEPEEEPEEDLEDEPEDEPLERPKNSAKTEEWREYAESIGIDTSKLKNRDDIRAAVESVE